MDIKIVKPSEEFLIMKKVDTWEIWSKEVSRFDWHYDRMEECYILEGRAVIKTGEGRKAVVRKGDFVTFPKGLSCIWDIKEPIRKHYLLR